MDMSLGNSSQKKKKKVVCSKQGSDTVLTSCYKKYEPKMPKHFSLNKLTANFETKSKLSRHYNSNLKRQTKDIKPSLLAASYLVGAQLSNEEDEPGTMDADESQGWSFASLDPRQASLGLSLLHRAINDLEEYISRPAAKMMLD